MTPRVAVIGTGRCGTGYVASRLRAAGLAAGHEEWWTLPGRPRTEGLDADCSWLALPAIEAGERPNVVVHVVRPRADVVTSFTRLRFFDRPTPYLRFARAHCAAVSGWRGATAAGRWWDDWAARCDAVADLRVRLADLTVDGTPGLARLSEAVGVRLTAGPVVNEGVGADV